MCWLVLAALAFPLNSAFAAPQAGEARGPARIGFPWFIAPQPQETRGTLFAPDAAQILQRDGLREARKERQFWDALRAKDERRIRDRYRIETEIALQRALAVAASRQAMARGSATKAASARLGTEDGSTAPSQVAVEEGSPPAPPPAPEDFMDRARETVDALKKEADKLVKGVDRTVDVLVPPAPRPESRRTSGVVFFFMLLALFLVPSFAVALILLGVIHLRNGHRLQSVIFGVAGGAALILVLAAVQEMRGESPARRESETARWRAECKESAVRVTGFVYDVAPGGVVISDVAGAAGDEFGCALIVTGRNSVRSGEKWEVIAYPVGQREAPNAIGLIRAMPAYADSLEQAVVWRAEAEQASSERWWHRLLRSMQEA